MLLDSIPKGGRLIKNKAKKLINIFSITTFLSLITLLIFFIYVSPYSFSWDEIPGNDSERFAGYLYEYVNDTQNKSININISNIAKINDNRTIQYNDQNTSFFINRIDDKKKVELEITTKSYSSLDVKIVNVDLNLEAGPYLLSWDEIPGKDGPRLVEYLKQNYDMNWIEREKFTKSPDGKAIRISDENENNSLSIRLNDNIKSVSLGFSEYLGKLDVKNDSGQLYLEAGQYLLNWNQIPGKDSDRLVEYLKQNFKDMDWIKTGRISSYKGNFISISGEDKFLDIDLNYDNTEASIKLYKDLGNLDVKNVNLDLYLDIPYDSLNWNEIPGKDRDKLLKYLKQKYHLNWIESGTIKKIENKSIELSNSNSIFIGVDFSDESKAHLTFYKYLGEIKNENGQLILEVGSYSLNWDEIPIQGTDGEKLIDYLKQNYEDMDWIEKGQIRKGYSGDTIYISNANKSISIELNYDKTEAILVSYPNAFKVKNESGQLILETDQYLLNMDEIPGNDSKKLIDYLKKNFGDMDWIESGQIVSYIKNSIKISNENYLSIDLNYDKTTANLYVRYSDVFKVKNESGQLILKAGPYSLNWDKIPGNDSERLRDYLKQKYNLNWIESGTIEKIDNETISMESRGHSLRIKLDYDKTRAYLWSYDRYFDAFKVENESGNLSLKLLESLSWNEIPGKDSSKLHDYLKKNYGMNIKKDMYFLSWDDIQGKDEGKISDFLERNYGIDREKVRIEKTDDNSILKLFADGKLFRLRLNNEKNGAILISEDRTDSFTVKKENEYLFSWNEVLGNDRALIRFLKKELDISWIETANIEKIDNEKTKVNLKIDDGRSAEFIAKSENGKLNIYKNKLNLYMDNIIKVNNGTTIQDYNGTSFFIDLGENKKKAYLSISNKSDETFDLKSNNGRLDFEVPRSKNAETEARRIFEIVVFISIGITLITYYIYINKLYKHKYTLELILSLEKSYPLVPFFIMAIGYSILLGAYYIKPSANFLSISLGASKTIVLIGIGLLAITLFAKKSLENHVYFTIKRAIRILDGIEDKDEIDINNLKRYIYLTFKNAKKKMGRRLELKAQSSDLEYTLLNYLPYYLEFGSKKQLYSLKNNLEIILESVDEKNKIDWTSFTPAIIKLDDDIIAYLRENNFNLPYQTSQRQLKWITESKDTIFQAIELIMPIILFFLSLSFGLGNT